jgi:hypothetical protein
MAAYTQERWLGGGLGLPLEWFPPAIAGVFLLAAGVDVHAHHGEDDDAE